jgi:hypothetical protein
MRAIAQEGRRDEFAKGLIHEIGYTLRPSKHDMGWYRIDDYLQVLLALAQCVLCAEPLPPTNALSGYRT